MNIKVTKLVVQLLILISLLVFSLSGCNNPNGTTSISTIISTTDTTTFSSITSLTTESPISSYFNLSQAPKLGETAELTFKVNYIRQPQEGLTKSKAWVDFFWTNIHGSYIEANSVIQIPLEEVLVSGETSWEGNFNESKVNLHSTIQLPREGIWRIQGNFIGEGWKQGVDFNYWVAVDDGTAAIMNTEGFETGPLAYLDNFPGGRGPQRIPTSDDPFSIGLDISKAPRAGEEVTLSCRVLSLIDMSDFSIRWVFLRRIGESVQEIPSTELLTGADLAWKTDIKKDVPVVFTTTIKFPTEGEWEISAIGNTEANKYKQAGAGDTIHITITSTRSYFGWAKLPQPPYSGTTLSTTT